MMPSILTILVCVICDASFFQALRKPSRADGGQTAMHNALDTFASAINTYLHCHPDNAALVNRVVVPYSSDTHALCDLHAQLVLLTIVFFIF